jgi:hypothetical protein
MNEDKKLYAVLTGDIIKSASLNKSDLDAVRAGLLDAVGVVKEWKRGLVRGKAEFFRGDAWQLLLTNPGKALRVGIYLRASLIAQGKADTRFSIGLGDVENVSKNRVSLSTGQAFALSGHGLDSMTQYSNTTIEAPKLIGPLAEWLPVIGHLCDSVMRQWTERQAEIVTIALKPGKREPTHEEIALKLTPRVSKQAVTKALNSANWHAIRECVQQFESSRWDSILKG